MSIREHISKISGHCVDNWQIQVLHNRLQFGARLRAVLGSMSTIHSGISTGAVLCPGLPVIMNKCVRQ